MYDAREPLFQHGIVLTGDGQNITIWNQGEEKFFTDITGLQELGLKLQTSNPPPWLETGGGIWPLSIVGKVLNVVASCMREINDCGIPIKYLYGGSLFGPANPDLRTAGLIIKEDHTTVQWRNG